MSSAASDGLNRRLMLGALATLPALPGLLDATGAEARTAAPLASWNDGPAKQAILKFVRATTSKARSSYVPPEDRIAEFDQDGTLWVLQSPFTFYRGSAGVMAADLARAPATGIHVQACGDAHLLNFGGFATPERRLIFDINDLDETLPAPWEWAIHRWYD